MNIRTSLRTGFGQTVRTPRLVFFAWAINLALALVVALPMYSLLDASIGKTVYDETLVQHMDQNWWISFKQDHPDNPIVELLDYSIMGAGAFLFHADALLRGGNVTPVVRFLYDFIFSWSVHWPDLGILLFIGLIGAAVNALLSGGFISAYAGDHPPTVSEFLSLGARHFGPFVRLALLVYGIQAIVLYPVLQGLGSWISNGTKNSPSEMIPFVLYVGKTLLGLTLFFLLSLVADYARIYIVTGHYHAAHLSLVKSVRFVVDNTGISVGVGLSLIFFTVLAMAFYALIDGAVPENTWLLIVALFVLQQGYMLVRQFLRAAAYACEVDVFQSSGIRS